jgi:hypothetical protein
MKMLAEKLAEKTESQNENEKNKKSWKNIIIIFPINIIAYIIYNYKKLLYRKIRT